MGHMAWELGRPCRRKSKHQALAWAMVSLGGSGLAFLKPQVCFGEVTFYSFAPVCPPLSPEDLRKALDKYSAELELTHLPLLCPCVTHRVIFSCRSLPNIMLGSVLFLFHENIEESGSP